MIFCLSVQLNLNMAFSNFNIIETFLITCNAFLLLILFLPLFNSIRGRFLHSEPTYFKVIQNGSLIYFFHFFFLQNIGRAKLRVTATGSWRKKALVQMSPWDLALRRPHRLFSVSKVLSGNLTSTKLGAYRIRTNLCGYHHNI